MYYICAFIKRAILFCLCDTVQETEMSRTGYGQLIASLAPFHHVRTVDYLWYIQAPSNTLIHLNVLGEWKEAVMTGQMSKRWRQSKRECM